MLKSTIRREICWGACCFHRNVHVYHSKPICAHRGGG